jgi:hypothetical protein
MKYVHRLVYESFRGPIPDGLEINHIDGNKKNNSLENLEAVTRKQNLHHAVMLIGEWRGKNRGKCDEVNQYWKYQDRP